MQNATATVFITFITLFEQIGKIFHVFVAVFADNDFFAEYFFFVLFATHSVLFVPKVAVPMAGLFQKKPYPRLEI